MAKITNSKQQTTNPKFQAPNHKHQIPSTKSLAPYHKSQIPSTNPLRRTKHQTKMKSVFFGIWNLYFGVYY